MSEARALTNFAGNSVATVLIGSWTGELDRDQAVAVLDGDDPFDELSLDPAHHGSHHAEEEAPQAAAPAR